LLTKLFCGNFFFKKNWGFSKKKGKKEKKRSKQEAKTPFFAHCEGFSLRVYGLGSP
jgi:hypothetical protein